MHDLAAGNIRNCDFKTCSACMILLQVIFVLNCDPKACSHVLAAGNTHMKLWFKTCSASMFSLQVIYITVILKPVLRA